MSDYFNKDTELAIIEFNNEEDINVRHKIFEERIKKCFEKLVENLIMIHRFNACPSMCFETLKDDCISFLYENLSKFDSSRGSKAFSYFDVMAKNFLLAQQNKANRKQSKEITYMEGAGQCGSMPNNTYGHSYNSYFVLDHEEAIIDSETKEDFVEELKRWKNKYKKERERVVLDGIIYLMEHCEDLDIINKKSVYLFLREITGLNSKGVVQSLNKFRRSYKFLKIKQKREG